VKPSWLPPLFTSPAEEINHLSCSLHLPKDAYSRHSFHRSSLADAVQVQSRVNIGKTQSLAGQLHPLEEVDRVVMMLLGEMSWIKQVWARLEG